MTDINELAAVRGSGELRQRTLQASVTAGDGDPRPGGTRKG